MFRKTNLKLLDIQVPNKYRTTWSTFKSTNAHKHIATNLEDSIYPVQSNGFICALPNVTLIPMTRTEEKKHQKFVIWYLKTCYT